MAARCRATWITRKSLENACAIVAATGGSTNAGLHIPAIAHEAGIKFTLEDVAAAFERTPLNGNLRPGGAYHAQDVRRIGGVAVIAKTLYCKRPSAWRYADRQPAARSPRNARMRPIRTAT